MERVAVKRPKQCHGNEHFQKHANGCRPARPLCRWMRRVQPQRRACECGAYHFPHRFGSGRCQHPERMELYVYGPIPEDDLVEREAIQFAGDEERPSGVYLRAEGNYLEATGSDTPF